MRRWALALLGAAVVAGLAIAGFYATRPSDEERLQEARLALMKQDYAQAELLALDVAKRPTADGWAWMVAAEAAFRAGRTSESLSYYEQVTEGATELRSSAAFGRGQICFQLSRLERAEREFRLALEADPNSLLAQRRLAELLNLTGRRLKAAAYIESLVRNSHGTLEDLLYLGDVDHALSQPEWLWEAIREPDADPLFFLGAGFQALAENRPAEARAHFERVLQARPRDPDAWAGWGQSLLEVAPGELTVWRDRLPREASEDAGVLAVLGQVAEREDRSPEAAHWYALAAERNATSRISWHRLGLVLAKLGRTAEAELALDRARKLQQIAIWLDDLFEHRNHLDLIRRVAEQLAVLGRDSEAVAWSRHALSISPREAWAVQLIAHAGRSHRNPADVAQDEALGEMLRKVATMNAKPSDRRDLNPAGGVGQRNAETGFGASGIRFVDSAQTTGLEFVYHSARDPGTPGARILETTGGGVGVLDFDGDGWPDLYFTQGSREFPLPPANPDRDRLFRNRQGEAWDDVSAAAGLDDEQFGQGLAAGDFNNDGFVDLYIANYGTNRLYQNQGDGSFRDATPAALHAQKVWTSSCAIVDLNRDGAPDLFDVTYCAGSDVETRFCQKQGVPRSCSPRAFAAEQDRLWINTGDGGWEFAADCGLDLPDGLGLGVVAFRPTPELPVGLFVANDETPNYWLVDANDHPGGTPRWENHALVGGVAVDADGKPQACMGVACDDANGDGLPDLFVTNFYHESNTLYLSASDKFFEDRTRSAGLRDPSWNMLGFGTQFLDADLDGWPDLLVANGHIDDLSAAGEPFEMPLQCFRNVGGVFRELTADDAGDCFARPALGRGLARIDWNRDGQEDAVVVNQESPAVLLTNVSAPTGRPLALQFRGTIDARDAIGTIVRIHIGPRVLTRQLTAGDGYQASNERQLVIGVGNAETVDQIEVHWPDGSRQDFGMLATGQQYVLIQGRDPAVPLRALPPR